MENTKQCPTSKYVESIGVEISKLASKPTSAANYGTMRILHGFAMEALKYHDELTTK